jgi:O-antigen ligase
MHYFKKIQPLIFPTTIFTLSIILAYIIAGRFLNEDWAFLLNTLGAIGFAYLACIYCNRLNDINKILWILIVIGALQLPLMFAQSHGWTDKLPANFSMLSSTFGQQDLGPLHNLMAHVTALRYGGIFGSPELMAEFLDIVALFCIGICLFGTSKKERLVAILALCLILAAGFYTGTRAFIWSLGVGLFVMLFLMTIKPGFSRNLAQLLAVGCFLGLILIFLSTQEIFRGYIYRFLQTDFSSNYYDSRNIVWSVSLSLLNKLPFTGYGGWMMEIFDTKGGAVFVGPHSIYLFMLLKAGYPGLIAIIAFISIPIYWMLRIFFRGINKTAQSWAIVLLSVWIFWAVNEIKIEFVRYPFYMDIIFLLFGIMASFYNMNIKHLKDVNVLIP